MEAIVLAGGLGTRLAPHVPGIPKPMAPVRGRPFLSYVLAQLKRTGVDRIILAVGYKHEVILQYFGGSYEGIPISYSHESRPLGTGGAIRQAASLLPRKSTVYVLNGDSLFDADLTEMANCHRKWGADITVALKRVRNTQRYGSVSMEGDRITAFHEKRPVQEAWINGGIYTIRTDVLRTLMLPESFSFEHDVLERYVGRLRMFGFRDDGYFIDIGIVEDYLRAQRELMEP